jgi:hypothetical protein
MTAVVMVLKEGFLHHPSPLVLTTKPVSQLHDGSLIPYFMQFCQPVTLNTLSIPPMTHPRRTSHLEEDPWFGGICFT